MKYRPYSAGEASADLPSCLGYDGAPHDAGGAAVAPPGRRFQAVLDQPLQEPVGNALTAALRASWGWTGIAPAAVVDHNEFGNLIVRDTAGQYWRICPEELDHHLVAANRDELRALADDLIFQQDWHMADVVELARDKFGALAPGRKYYLKVPSVLGGEYACDNLGTIGFVELIAASGRLAQQINGLPSQVQAQLKR